MAYFSWLVELKMAQYITDIFLNGAQSSFFNLVDLLSYLKVHESACLFFDDISWLAI